MALPNLQLNNVAAALPTYGPPAPPKTPTAPLGPPAPAPLYGPPAPVQPVSVSKPPATAPSPMVVASPTKAITSLNNTQNAVNTLNTNVATQAATVAANQAATSAATQTQTADQKAAADQAAADKAKADALNKAATALTGEPTTEAGPTPGETQTGTTYADISKQLDDLSAQFNTSMLQFQNGTFPLSPAQQAVLNSTKAVYDNMVLQQQSANNAATAGAKMANVRLGLNVYAPFVAMGNIQTVVNQGLTQINTIEANSAKALADLNQSLDESNYNRVNSLYDKLNQSLKDKTDVINNINDQVTKQADLALRQHQQQMADLKQEDEKQQAAIKFAVDNQVTKPAYLIGNTAINTKTGEPLSLADYQALTGQQVGLPENQTDFSFLQTGLQTPQDRALAQNQSQFETSEAEKIREFNAQQSLEYAKLNASTANGTPGTVPPQLEPYAHTSYNGIDYVDLSGITNSSLRDKYAQMASQSGLKVVTNTADASKLNAIADANTNLQKIADSVNPIPLGVGAVAPGQGVLNTFSQIFGNTELKSYKAWRTAIINNVQALAGGAGSGLRINSAEINAALDNDLPIVTGVNADTHASATAKLDRLKTQLDTWEQQLVGGGNTADRNATSLSAPVGTTQMTGPEGTFDVPNNQIELFKQNGYQ